jgi:membrane peptidoglycan carboxypeptidase
LKNPEKDLERKAKEIVLAIRLDSMFNKNKILVYYMNSVYFGRGANKQNLYGVQAAARGLFNVDAKDLNLPQAAYIAGMVQSPNDYNPFRGEKNLKSGINRMKLALHDMLVNGKITQKQYDEALRFNQGLACQAQPRRQRIRQLSVHHVRIGKRGGRNPDATGRVQHRRAKQTEEISHYHRPVRQTSANSRLPYLQHH